MRLLDDNLKISNNILYIRRSNVVLKSIEIFILDSVMHKKVICGATFSTKLVSKSSYIKKITIIGVKRTKKKYLSPEFIKIQFAIT